MGKLISMCDDLKKRYDCDDKFKVLVDTFLGFIVGGEFTPFELSQALTLAFLIFEEKRSAPHPIVVPPDKVLINIDNEK